MAYNPWVQIGPNDIFPTSTIQTVPTVNGKKYAQFVPPDSSQNVYFSSSDANNLQDAVVALSSGTVVLGGLVNSGTATPTSFWLRDVSSSIVHRIQLSGGQLVVI